jgi:hypothetical protein
VLSAAKVPRLDAPWFNPSCSAQYKDPRAFSNFWHLQVHDLYASRHLADSALDPVLQLCLGLPLGSPAAIVVAEDTPHDSHHHQQHRRREQLQRRYLLVQQEQQRQQQRPAALGAGPPSRPLRWLWPPDVLGS